MDATAIKVYPRFFKLRKIHLDSASLKVYPWLAAISFTDEFHSSMNRD